MAAPSRILSRVAVLALPVALLVTGATASPVGHRCRSNPMIGQVEPADSDPSAPVPFDVDPIAVLPGLTAARSDEFLLAVPELRPPAQPTFVATPLAVAPKTSPPACA